jgi:hypothetical protein
MRYKTRQFVIFIKLNRSFLSKVGVFAWQSQEALPAGSGFGLPTLFCLWFGRWIGGAGSHEVQPIHP